MYLDKKKRRKSNLLSLEENYINKIKNNKTKKKFLSILEIEADNHYFGQ
jgi:hypothetical protein